MSDKELCGNCFTETKTRKVSVSVLVYVSMGITERKYEDQQWCDYCASCVGFKPDPNMARMINVLEKRLGSQQEQQIEIQFTNERLAEMGEDL